MYEVPKRGLEKYLRYHFQTFPHPCATVSCVGYMDRNLCDIMTGFLRLHDLFRNAGLPTLIRIWGFPKKVSDEKISSIFATKQYLPIGLVLLENAERHQRSLEVRDSRNSGIRTLMCVTNSDPNHRRGIFLLGGPAESGSQNKAFLPPTQLSRVARGRSEHSAAERRERYTAERYA